MTFFGLIAMCLMRRVNMCSDSNLDYIQFKGIGIGGFHTIESL